MTEEEVMKISECSMLLISVYQNSFLTLRKENPDLLMEEVISLTGQFWKGFMMGVCNGKV